MKIGILFPLAGAITLTNAGIIWFSASRGREQLKRCAERSTPWLLFMSIAITIWALIVISPVTQKGVNFTLASGIALASIIIQTIYAFGVLRHGIHGLGLFVLPITGLPLVMIPFLPQAHIARWIHTSSLLETGHLLISLLAYAILTLAAVHALMQLLLDRALKKKQMGSITNAMPSLIEIHAHMFAQVRLATWLVGISILTGLSWQWIELHRFALFSHKVLLALFSFAVLILVLSKRHQARWTGSAASKLVIAAYALLLLAYFGVTLIQDWKN